MSQAPRLDDLISLVHAQADEGDAVAQLQVAASLKSDLDDLTDALLGHFVDQARRAGASWSQIGEALGVTKQAAQQRHTTTDSIAKRLLATITPRWLREGPGFMARFTDRARTAVVAAQDEARSMKHAYIGTEHLLLGAAADPVGVAARVLADQGVSVDDLRADIAEQAPAGDTEPKGHIPFTPRAKTALELALREALSLGHNYIGTEHQLLGLLREEKGLAAEVLGARGVTYEKTRERIIVTLATLR